MRDKTMTKQDKIEEGVIFAVAFDTYYVNNKAVEDAKTKREDARKLLEPVIRAHKIPVGDNKAWKALQPEFNKAFLMLEWPTDDDGKQVELDDISETALKQVKAKVAAWLGVLRTCLEYQILPTDKNADRLRKAKVWTGLNGNGKMNPNWVDPNAPKVEPTPATAPTATAPTARQTQTTTKVASVKAATAQKSEDKVHPLTSNVSSNDAPLSAREHFKVLFNQMTKNEVFREEYCGILALMLDVEKATLTRCMIQANDEVKV